MRPERWVGDSPLGREGGGVRVHGKTRGGLPAVRRGRRGVVRVFSANEERWVVGRKHGSASVREVVENADMRASSGAAAVGVVAVFRRERE